MVDSKIIEKWATANWEFLNTTKTIFVVVDYKNKVMSLF